MSLSGADNLQCPGQGIHQINPGDRFNQIIDGTGHERIFHILEIIITTDHKSNNIRVLVMYDFQKLDPIHKGHVDIRNQNIRLICFNAPEHFFPIRCRFHAAKGVSGPADHGTQLFPGPVFIIRYQDFIDFFFHCSTSPIVSLATVRYTRVPVPGALSTRIP